MVDKVFGANVLIEQAEVNEVTKSGLILPTNKGQKKNIGKVIKVGRGHINFNGEIVPMEVNVGDIVMFQPYAGTKILDEGNEYIIINEKDILISIKQNNG